MTRKASRSDGRANRDRILEIATTLLRQDPDATLDEIALAVGVSRATLYRHFENRRALLNAVQIHARDDTDGDGDAGALRPAGQFASPGPVVLDVAEVLGKVAPHLLGEQIVAEAQRLAGVRSVALYLIDIDGTRLRRLAGSQEFPDEIVFPLAVGPEIPRAAMPALQDRLAAMLPASVIAPMLLRGRALGALIAIDAPEGPLLELARHAAAAITLAESYTDVFDAARRHRDISAASEIQQNLLPPRIARISGGLLAGTVLPGYDIGGDWFDYVENPDGAWVAVADAAGSGTNAAAIGAVTLGAFRAKRRRNAPLEDTVNYIEQTLGELTITPAISNATIARWHGPTASFFWVTCGETPPYLITPNRRVAPLPGPTLPSLGRRTEQTVTAHAHRVHPDEIIVIVSDGVLERRRSSGGTLGIEVVETVARDLDHLSAPAVVSALEQAIISASDDHLEDDATIVCFEPITAS